MKTHSISQLFEAVELVIYHLTENKDLQQTMTGYSFTPKRVQEGNAILQKARGLHENQEDQYDGTRDLSKQITSDREAALDVFKGHVALTKSIFRKDPGALKTLKIKTTARGKWALIKQAVEFYKKAPKYMDTLAQHGITQAAIDQNKAAVQALLTLKADRLKKKGDAENTTQLKKESIRELKAWYGEFRQLARIAFKKNPQVLETFGMVVPSE